jgi:hypothetical protein
MATIYKINMEITSDFVAYSENDIKNIIQEQLDSFIDEETGLMIRTRDIEVIKK